MPFLTDDEEQEALVKDTLKAAKANMTNDSALMPTFFLLGEDGELTIFGIAIDFEDAKTKNVLAVKLKQEAWKRKAVMVMFTTEAWIGTPPNNDPNFVGKVKDLPTKYEAIILTVERRNHTARTYISKVTRDAEEKVTDLSEWEEWTGMKGRMFGFLPQLQ